MTECLSVVALQQVRAAGGGRCCILGICLWAGRKESRSVFCKVGWFFYPPLRTGAEKGSEDHGDESLVKSLAPTMEDTP